MNLNKPIISILLIFLICQLLLGLQVGSREEGIVSLFHINEGTGDTTFDSVGSNHGTITNCAWVTGKFHNCLYFDGTGDFVNCGNDSSLDLSGGEFTIMAWVYYRGVGEDGEGGTIIARHDLSDGLFWYLKESISHFFWQDDVAQWTFVIDFEAITDTWSHMAIVRDGTNDTAYINTVEVGQHAKNSHTTVTTDFYIGRLHPSASLGFNGDIDELTVWNIALSQGELVEFYKGGQGKHIN